MKNITLKENGHGVTVLRFGRGDRMKQSTIQAVLGLICLAASLWLSYRQGVLTERRRWQQCTCTVTLR